MSKLPLLEKNAYLVVVVSHGMITANLTYSHYDIHRAYTLTDRLILPVEDFHRLDADFWDDYFQKLSLKFDWTLFTSGMVAHEGFQDEGKGVAGVSVKVMAGVPGAQQIVKAVRAFSISVLVEILDDDRIAKNLDGIGSKLGYKDILHLDLNLRSFKVNRYKKEGGNSIGATSSTVTAKISWDNQNALIENFKSAKFKAFLSTQVDPANLMNVWANFVLSNFTYGSDGRIKDLVRAFITAQLLSMSNDNPELSRTFGQHKDGKSMIIVTGDLVSHLRDKALYLAILDGLQLKGWFDLTVDPDRKALSFGETLGMGVNAGQFIILKDEVVTNLVRLFVPEVPGQQTEEKVIFKGMVTTQNDRHELLSISNRIYTVELDKDFKSIFDGEFIRGAYIENLDGVFTFVSDPQNEYIEKAVIDGRFKPAIYGPNPQANKIRLDEWLNE